MQNACNNARLLVSTQDISITMQQSTFQSIHTQKSYHRVEWIDQSSEKRALAIDHAR